MNNSNMLHSECSSGCESGWTLYLEQSFVSHRGNGNFYSEEKRAVKDEYEEENLSLVSDASSGPPNFHEDHYFDNGDNRCLFRAPIEATLEKNRGKNKKNTEINQNRKVQEQQSSFLDDTASSPIFNFSQKNFTVTDNQASMEENILDFSEGCSSTHFEGKSALYEPYGFFQSSFSKTQLHQNQWFGGKMGMR